MPSSYTDNNKIEKIGTGEQAGTWGTTTNTNFDIVDAALSGVVTFSVSGATSNLTSTTTQTHPTHTHTQPPPHTRTTRTTSTDPPCLAELTGPDWLHE